MRKLAVFLLGLISGAVLTWLILLISEHISTKTNDGMIFFEQPGEFFSTNDFEVIQVIGDKCALAYEINDEFGDMSWLLSLTESIITGGKLVLIINDNDKYYYDGQVIKVPRGKCMRQIGVYKYQTNNDYEKTVPIVKLMDK